VNLVLLNLKMRRYDEALSAARTLHSLWGDHPTVLGLLTHTYAVSGQKEEAQRILRQLTAQSEERPGSSFHLAVAHLGLGEKARSIELLEKAVAEKNTGLVVYLGAEPLFDPLRTEPRFQALLEKMGLTGRR
jgi:serine/threonine-protein kinase